MTLKKNRNISQHRHYYAVARASGKYYEYEFRDANHIRRLRTTNPAMDNAIIIHSAKAKEQCENEITFISCIDIRNSKYKFYYDVNSAIVYCSLRKGSAGQ